MVAKRACRAALLVVRAIVALAAMALCFYVISSARTDVERSYADPVRSVEVDLTNDLTLPRFNLWVCTVTRVPVQAPNFSLTLTGWTVNGTQVNSSCLSSLAVPNYNASPPGWLPIFNDGVIM